MCFAMGMMETIQLLLQPLEKGQAPWQKSEWLGRHVQSHIDYNSAKLVDVDRKRMEQVFPNVYLKGRKYQPKLRVTAERQREDETLNIAGAISFISLGSVERDVRQMKSAARNFLRGNWSAIGLRDTLPALRRLPHPAATGIQLLCQPSCVLAAGCDVLAAGALRAGTAVGEPDYAVAGTRCDGDVPQPH